MSAGEVARNCVSIIERGIDRMEREQRLAREAREAMRDAIKKTPVRLVKVPGACVTPGTAEYRGQGRLSDERLAKLSEAVSLGYNLTKSAAHAGCVPSTARRYMKWIREGKV